MHLDPAWIALIGTLCGGAGLKLLEHWLGKSKLKIDEATKLRDELRIELTSQRDEIKTLETEIDKWRRDYYDLRDKYASLNTEYLIALEKIKTFALEKNTEAVENSTKTVQQAIDPPQPQ